MDGSRDPAESGVPPPVSVLTRVSTEREKIMSYVQPHECPKCCGRTTGGFEDKCAHCGWKPGLIVDNATVTVKDAVDGTKKRKKSSGYTRKAITTTLSMDDVRPDVAEAARSIRKPGQVFIIVDTETVRVVNR